ncbi:hypothetical protein ABIC28_002671 [Rhodococcus sp. PvR044]|jgi:hypothetical protein|uniref:hypothetical protein n=1 Tax=unclassified Rhodococcus (in: high G+C Gram-positive bacteria) TaxID=192944 RepID=UPI000BD4EB8B|nr:hypothetical protein [Rhodococcus sp. PvR099]MBP1162095.1 hypothetical protein [Rhodococcus sp. PvR099]PTR43197.1 hypothetical protein C8K38_10868 [Rhodococcus sp. OK611]SNX91061.1 hypothetical protein SAMN05447004_10867 [Rhodococcus sp. OK270]
MSPSLCYQTEEVEHVWVLDQLLSEVRLRDSERHRGMAADETYWLTDTAWIGTDSLTWVLDDPREQPALAEETH